MSYQQYTQTGTQSQFEQQPSAVGGQQSTTGQMGSQGYSQGTQFDVSQRGIQGQQTGGMEQMGQGQLGGAGMTGQMDLKLDEAISENMRLTLYDLGQSVNVCEWCAERCVDHGPEMAECLRLCRDTAELASLNAKLIARDSVFGPEALEVFIAAADACAAECAKHRQSHCQECAEVLTRTVQSAREMLASFDQPQGQHATVGQFQGVQSTQQF